MACSPLYVEAKISKNGKQKKYPVYEFCEYSLISNLNFHQIDRNYILPLYHKLLYEWSWASFHLIIVYGLCLLCEDGGQHAYSKPMFVFSCLLFVANFGAEMSLLLAFGENALLGSLSI